MPRKYIKKTNRRKYANYSPVTLEKCLQAIRSGKMTQRKAEEKFKIPRRTILNKLKNQHTKKPGKSTIFTEEEEIFFTKCFQTFYNWGFSLNTFDLRVMVNSYLIDTGRKVSQFINNVPGIEWSIGFLERHPDLVPYINSSSFRSRIEITEEILIDYISNLSEILNDVSEDNIWILDQLNTTDHPGRKKVIVKRNASISEKINYSLKTGVSVVFVGNAGGDYFPPELVYRPACLWPRLEESDEEKSVNKTNDDWISSHTFSKWFETTMYPILKGDPRKKVIICDNLSSHLTMNLLSLCEQSNTTFLCLPSNSSHVTHPMELRFFYSMRTSWLRLLLEFEEATDGYKNFDYQKDNFSSLMENIMEAVHPNVSNGIISGFKICGIYPVAADKILYRIMEIQNDKNNKGPTLQESLGQEINQWVVKKPVQKEIKVEMDSENEDPEQDPDPDMTDDDIVILMVE